MAVRDGPHRFRFVVTILDRVVDVLQFVVMGLHPTPA